VTTKAASSTTTQHILVVEDDETIWRGLNQALTAQGYRVTLASTGAAALDAVDLAEEPDLVLLDLGLPDMDGIEVCRRLRVRHPEATVVMLTARSEEIDIVLGLDAGADDYLTKPFHLSELLARIRAHLRRQVTTGSVTTADIGDLHIDFAAHRVKVHGEDVLLRAKEFDLLTILVRDVGNVLTREVILDEVWDISWPGSSRTLDQHISSLRRRLGDVGEHIVTVRGVGFRFDP
jgi:DNA-binding response OmpR family regulator